MYSDTAHPVYSPKTSFVRHHYLVCGFTTLVIALVIAVRLYLGVWLLDYVNRVLGTIKGFHGSVESIDIDLYRGAYRINHLKLFKETGKIPVPFIEIDQTYLSLEWGTLFHGRIVSHADLIKPVINFAIDTSGEEKQTGANVDWTKPIKDLMPIDINYVTFTEGKLTYRDFSTTPKVDIYIHHMSGEVRNLRNVVAASQPLPSIISLTGDSIGQGTLKITGRMNILKNVPDMDIDMSLENVQMQALSDYSNAYAAVDIKGGNLSVYSKVVIKNDQVSGYIKPIATHISLIDLKKDANPVKVVWESLVAVVMRIFTNIPKDQFATRIELQGSLKNINTDTWSAIGGIIRNAFVESLKKGVDPDTKAIPAHTAK